MIRNPLKYWIVIAASLMTGCATSKEEMLPAGNSNMLALWDGIGRANDLVAARQSLRRSLTASEQDRFVDDQHSYSRTQAAEISQQFPRLPNPDMVMYIFPHLAQGNTPVPGYSTVFSFYEQTQYAMPGERTEAL